MQYALSTITRTMLSGIFLCVLLLVSAVAAELKNPINKGPDDVAIRGYDTVAYFTQSRPVEGKPEFAYQWQDMTWHFASAKHRDLFAADPERYAPQFGGHCAMALTQDTVKVIDPEAWIISDGRLYLTFSKKGRDLFRQDVPSNIKKAEDNWARLHNQK